MFAFGQSGTYNFTMNTKIITAIVAFLIAFGFSTAITRLFVAPAGNFYSFRSESYTQNRQKIHALLQQDVRNGLQRRAKLDEMNIDLSHFSVESVVAEAELVAEYTDSSANINDSDLPHEFQAAWREHMKAWREHAEFYNRVKHSCERRRLTDDQIAETSAKQSRKIDNTWYKVLRIAKRYDAIPDGAY